MEDLLPYLFSYPSFSTIAYRYKQLNECSSLLDLEQKISPLLRAEELRKIRTAATQLKLETEQRGASVVDYYHSLYPKLLRQIEKPPIALFYKGNLDLLQHELVSVVGTRKPTPISSLASSLLPEMLSKSRNLGIVSGVATGIDRVVMLASIQANIPTIGIMGTGIEKEYPYQNRDLYKLMNHSSKCLLITEMRIGEIIGKWSFPRRNRIITGIANLLVLMEAPLKSGAMSSVYHALEQGREVLVFDDPELLYNEGGRKLIEEGANKLTLSELKGNPKAFFHISEVIPKDYKEMPSLFSSLSQLENEGLFQNVGGGYYRKNATLNENNNNQDFFSVSS